MANQPKNYKKFVATAATATLVASAIVPVASAASFSDIEGNTHADAIKALSDAGIIKGYEDGTFKPNAEINRGQTVKLLGRWLETKGYKVPENWNTVQRFNDLPVNAVDQELVKYAALVKDAGVFNGSNGNLNYSQPMQRQQMALVLVRAIKTVEGIDLIKEYKDAGYTSKIKDLDKAYSTENVEAITALEYAGITVVENFNPTSAITRGQFASFLNRTINYEAPVKVESVSAITDTTVTVVLEKAPTKELTPSSFKVVGNTVTKVEKGNYDTIYTLTLGTSLNGTKGILNVNGVEKAYDFTQLKLDSVKAKNLRQLEVKFSKELDVAGLAANGDGTYNANGLLDNLHIWMTKEEDGAVKTNSFASILGTNKSDWKATLGADKKTLVVESTDGSLLTNPKGTGLDLKLNETYQVEAKDILDATGKYSDVSYVSEILKDDVRPSVTASASVFTSGVNANKLTLTFSEPVKELKAAGSKAKIYIDGSEVPAEAITDVVTTGTVAQHSTVTIDTTKAKLGFELSKGAHKVAVVGAEDLNGNLLSNNAQELTFNVVDPADVQVVEPVVNNVVQIADNAFKVVFNTDGVVPNSTTPTDKILTIKNGAYDSTSGSYKDIDLTVADFVGASPTAKPKLGKVTAVEVPATSTTPAHTEWIVVVDAVADVDAAKLSYKGANVITRDIDVIDYKNASKVGKKATKSLSFTKDVTAPVVSTVTKTAKAQIGVKFSDGPFTTDGNGLVEYVSGKLVTVKYTDKEGVTYSEEVTPVLAADGVTLNLKLTNPKMLDNSSDLIAGATYSIVLPDAVVKDANEDVDGNTAPDYLTLDGQHPFVGKTVTYTVPGSSTLGKVPQTTKGLIFTGSEVKNGIGGTFVQNVKTAAKLTLKDNQIVVVFEGEVDPKTATVASNYVLGGKVLPAATTIEYRQVDIDDVAGEENFVIITLPDNVVSLTGGQDFAVSGVANKAGNKMMPVADVIQLTDNTQPAPVSITVRDSNKLVLTFPEEIVLKTADMTQLARNFKITANGKVVSLLNAAVEDRTKLVITTADNFDNAGSLNVPVSIELKVDSDGNMFIEDLAGNKAKATTVTK